jgi:hypothetical protein
LDDRIGRMRGKRVSRIVVIGTRATGLNAAVLDLRFPLCWPRMRERSTGRAKRTSLARGSAFRLTAARWAQQTDITALPRAMARFNASILLHLRIGVRAAAHRGR